MSILKSIRNVAMTIKLIALRLSGYVSLINIGMILFLTLSNMKANGYIDFDIGQYAIPIYLGTVFILFLLGYLEMYVFRGLHEEIEIQYKLMPIHPELQDMKRKIDKMYKERKKWK